MLHYLDFPFGQILFVTAIDPEQPDGPTDQLPGIVKKQRRRYTRRSFPRRRRGHAMHACLPDGQGGDRSVPFSRLDRQMRCSIRRVNWNLNTNEPSWRLHCSADPGRPVQKKESGNWIFLSYFFPPANLSQFATSDGFDNVGDEKREGWMDYLAGAAAIKSNNISPATFWADVHWSSSVLPDNIPPCQAS